jgi:6,7-dimethyl-8-ribityllumazine synthase
VASPDRAALGDGALEEIAGRVGRSLRGSHDGAGLRVGIACGLFNGGITQALLDGALDGLAECGVDRADVTVAWAPGAFELPLVAQRFAGSEEYDAVICLGAVVRGETGHYDFVAGECAAGIQRVQLDTGVPVVFGVLTTETFEQAFERSAPGDGNKGREAAHTAVEMVRLLRDPHFD